MYLTKYAAWKSISIELICDSIEFLQRTKRPSIQTLIQLGFTQFYQVLLGFSRFYWVLLVSTGFYWVLLGFNQVLLGFTGFYWVLLGFTGFCRVLSINQFFF